MCRINWRRIVELVSYKDDDKNLISAVFHMFTVTLISMSLVDLTWFSISGNICVPYLTLGEFFWFGFTNGINYADYDCIDSSIVNMMRIIILQCFMAMIFSLVGFYMDLVGPNSYIYKMARKYAIPGVCTVLFIMTIVTTSYYVVMLLEDSIKEKYEKSFFDVCYGLGFYLVAVAGGLQGLNLLYNLLMPYKSSYQDDDRCLIDAFDDNRMGNITPPPPYSLPPPPYTP